MDDTRLVSWLPPPPVHFLLACTRLNCIGSVPQGTIDPLTGVPVVTSADDQYECHRLDALSKYIGRLSIHWGDSSSARRAWVQRANKQNKEIIELTKIFREEAFPGFTKLIRPLSEIETMPPTWKETLRSKSWCVSARLPTNARALCGSALQDGFLGRWEAYATNSHGGNIGLRIRDPSDYIVSVLEVAGSSATVDDIIALENTWKTKLHSRDIGLNRN